MDVGNLNLFITQEESFIWNILSTAYSGHVDGFSDVCHKNIRGRAQRLWAEFAGTAAVPGLRLAMMELHASQVDQTYRLGMITDAQLMIEEQSRKGDLLVIDGQKRYRCLRTRLRDRFDRPGPQQGLPGIPRP